MENFYRSAPREIAELEARIADLRIAERELEALDAAPALWLKPKAKAKRKPTTDDESKAPRTVGAAIAEVLSRSGALRWPSSPSR